MLSRVDYLGRMNIYFFFISMGDRENSFIYNHVRNFANGWI